MLLDSIFHNIMLGGGGNRAHLHTPLPDKFNLLSGIEMFIFLYRFLRVSV